jgi:hypothetical protein
MHDCTSLVGMDNHQHGVGRIPDRAKRFALAVRGMRFPNCEGLTYCRIDNQVFYIEKSILYRE